MSDYALQKINKHSLKKWFTVNIIIFVRGQVEKFAVEMFGRVYTSRVCGFAYYTGPTQKSPPFPLLGLSLIHIFMLLRDQL